MVPICYNAKMLRQFQTFYTAFSHNRRQLEFSIFGLRLRENSWGVTLFLVEVPSKTYCHIARQRPKLCVSEGAQ